MIGAKTLSKPMPVRGQKKTQEQLQGSSNPNMEIFIQEHAFDKIVCKMAVILFLF